MEILRATLALDSRFALDATTVLLGALPELDSLALVSLLQALESEFGIVVADDEVSAELFATVASLCAFVGAKQAVRADGACSRSS